MQNSRIQAWRWKRKRPGLDSVFDLRKSSRPGVSGIRYLEFRIYKRVRHSLIAHCQYVGMEVFSYTVVIIGTPTSQTPDGTHARQTLQSPLPPDRHTHCTPVGRVETSTLNSLFGQVFLTGGQQSPENKCWSTLSLLRLSKRLHSIYSSETPATHALVELLRILEIARQRSNYHARAFQGHTIILLCFGIRQ